MEPVPFMTRRTLLSAIAAAPLALRAADSKHIPVGLELFSVRDDLKKDPAATLRGVAKAGYECVEFFSPYFDWTPEYAKQTKSQLDELGLRCYSTHNGPASFTPEGLVKAIELNKILGSHYVVLASAGNVEGAEGWKRVADLLNKGNEKLQGDGLHAGYHNHDAEWKSVGGQRPMDILAANTDKSVMLQLDVGTCVAEGQDPVAWIEKNPGRIRSLHLKEWSPQQKYRVLFGAGVAPWKKIFAAAETTGGVEYYLIEQEGSEYPEMETAERCLVAFKDIHG
jgi:sugar phosphate isomerase/epimerase